MRFTYVIGYRHSPDRIINLRRTIDWLSGFNNIDLVLIEQDKYSKISHLNLRAKHLFLKTDKPYNRSWAFNVAIKRNNNPIIIFGDSDLVMDPHQFIESINQMDKYEVVSPYSTVLDLTPDESMLDINGMSQIKRPGRGEEDNQKINLCGGIVMFRADSIVKIGGFCEQFEGWGAEDNFQTMKVEKMGLTFKEMPYKAYHLWHQKSQVDMGLYQKSLSMLEQMDKLDRDKIQMHINATLPKIGFLNKYY